MRKIMAVLLIGMLLAVCGIAAGEQLTTEQDLTELKGVQWSTESRRFIVPKEAAWDGSVEGEFCIGVKDAGHLEEGSFTLSLYAEDLYDREAIEDLNPGDKVVVEGETYTVGLIRIHGMVDSDNDGDPDLSAAYVKDLDREKQDLLDSLELVIDGDFRDAPESFVLSAYELIMTEEFYGYIAFEPVSETECRSVVDDRTPCTYLGEVTVLLPLPDSFVFLDSMDEELDAEAFLEDISEERYSPYNSYAWFEGGQLVRVSHSDYPSGD